MNISSSRAFGNARKALIGLLLVGASCVSSQASAALVLFNLTGGATASFTLDQSPTPSYSNASVFGIIIVHGVLQGAPETFNLNFFNDAGFSILSQNTYINMDGPSLFSGTTAAPKFILGNYSRAGAFGPIDFPISGVLNLSITRVTDAVPEPSTWMMMLVGFGFLGGAMRYGRKANAGTQTASLT